MNRDYNNEARVLSDIEIIKKTIRERRDRWLLSSVAEGMGVSHGYLRQVLNGFTQLTEKKRKMFFDYLGIDQYGSDLENKEVKKKIG